MWKCKKYWQNQLHRFGSSIILHKLFSTLPSKPITSHYLLSFPSLFLIQLTRATNCFNTSSREIIAKCSYKKLFVCVNFLKSKVEYALNHLVVTYSAKNVPRTNYTNELGGPSKEWNVGLSGKAHCPERERELLAITTTSGKNSHCKRRRGEVQWHIRGLTKCVGYP